MGQVVVSVFAAMCVITALIGMLADESFIAGAAVGAWWADMLLARAVGIMKGEVPAWAFILAPLLLLALLALFVGGLAGLRAGLTPPPAEPEINPPYATDPSYRHSRQADEDVIECAAVAHQRLTGRERGQVMHCYLTPGHGYEARAYARWLDKHGEDYGVILHVMDSQGQELTGADRQLVLKKGN